MAKAKKEQSAAKIVEDCLGGLSWNRKNFDHKKGKYPDVICYRCRARMGCSSCVENPKELICLNCHNWAHRQGVEQHGNVVVSDKMPHVRTDKGWLHYDKNFSWPAEQQMRDEIFEVKEKLKLRDDLGPPELALFEPTKELSPEEIEREKERRRLLAEQARNISQ